VLDLISLGLVIVGTVVLYLFVVALEKI